MLKIGDHVELLVDRTAYYSEYAGNPKVIIRKGSVGTVGAVKVPAVYTANRFFHCVDFVLPGVFRGDIRGDIRGDKSNTTWRVAVFSGQYRKTNKPFINNL